MNKQKALFYLTKLKECQTESGRFENDNYFFQRGPTGWLENKEEILELWKFLDGIGYIEPFDYMKTYLPIGGELLENSDWVEDANKSKISTFLFFVGRFERFHDGLWRHLICSGSMTRIFTRILDLENIDSGLENNARTH